MLLLLTLYLAVWPLLCWSKTVIVNNTNCLSGCSPCITLDYACENLIGEGTELILNPGTHTVHSDIVVNNVSNLTLLGDNATVRCLTGVGIKFLNIKDLVLSGLAIVNCGTFQNNTQQDNNSLFLSAVFILNSTDVTVEFVEFIANNGTALTMFDTSGNVSITNVTFQSNSIPKYKQYSGGGGLYIKFTKYNTYKNCYGSQCYSSNCYNTYTITNCSFLNNTARLFHHGRTLYLSRKGPVINVLGGGGGLQIVLEEKPQHNLFSITNAFFSHNNAEFGGGISIIVSDESSHNNFELIGINLEGNVAREGGGGIDFGYYTTQALEGNNKFCLERIQFSFNHARFGGGLQHYSARSSPDLSSNTRSSVQFVNCSWTRNSAVVGAAVALYPEVWQNVTSGYLSTPVFINCHFENNLLEGFSDPSRIRGGVFFTGGLPVHFYGNVSFLNNHGSAMHVSAAEIHVLANTVMKFDSNQASRGAAITLMGDSYIIAYNNSHILFQNNKAQDKGGAIFYYSINSLGYLNSYKCFIRYIDLVPVNEWNATFTFINNTANVYGHSIYATTLQPCARSDVTNVSGRMDVTDVFHWSPFSFTPSLESKENKPKHIITTDPYCICTVRNEKNHSCFPGQNYHLPITIKDELHQEMDYLLTVSYSNSFTTTNVTYIENTQSITLKGEVNSTVSVSLNTSSNNHIVGYHLYVHLTECPPGYYWMNGICECIASSQQKVLGIFACNQTLGQAYMRVGFWAGCSTNGQLVTSVCPLRFCTFNQTTNSLVLLPSRCSELDESICGPAMRKGRLCGECKSEYSVFYHSDRFRCAKCSQNSNWYGFLRYIASELLPLTILFCLIILFDVSLTSGVVNSFVFFAQILDISEVSAYSRYNLPSQITNLSRAYWFLFGFLNFDFFRHDTLSFCLFNKATVLDVLAFKYVTTLYGLFLVCCLFFLFKINRLNKILQKIRSSKSKHYTVTNGLTAFLIISYSQCSKVSFQILAHIRISPLHANGSEEDTIYLSGNTEYFGQEHIKYAIPAILVSTFAVIVPLVLTLNPIYHSCMASCKRRPFTNCSSVNPFSKLLLYSKPIIDALQGCYKDHCRFFAGLMFLYRLAISAAFAFTTSNIHGFAVLEVIIIFILMTHATFQPYQKRLYNIIDSLIFANLAIINAITLFNNTSIEYDIPSRHTTVLGAARIILVYIPIVCFICLLLIKLISYVKKRCKQQNESSILVNDHFIDAEDSSGFASNTLPARMMQEDLRASNVNHRRSICNLDSNSTEMFSSDKFDFMTTRYGTT